MNVVSVTTGGVDAVDAVRKEGPGARRARGDDGDDGGDDDGGEGVRVATAGGVNTKGVGEVEMRVDDGGDEGVDGSVRSKLVIIRGGGDAHVVAVVLRGEGVTNARSAAAADAGEMMVVMRDETGEAWVTLGRPVGIEQASEPEGWRAAGEAVQATITGAKGALSSSC